MNEIVERFSVRIYKQDYFGFVYVWMDVKRKRFYIGSHMGSIDDGYICSSKWMKKTYARRSDTFKRRIVFYLSTTDRSDLLKEEKRWLDMIKDHELGKRYFNHCRNAYGLPPEIISSNMKKAWTPERKAAHAAKLKARWESGAYVDRDVTPSIEGKARQMEALAVYNKERVYSDETRQKMSESAKKRGSNRLKYVRPSDFDIWYRETRPTPTEIVRRYDIDQRAARRWISEIS